MADKMEAACRIQDRSGVYLERANELLDEANAALNDELARRKIVEVQLKTDIKCLSETTRKLEAQLEELAQRIQG